MIKKRWKNPDKRMAAAVRYREGGMSLREIGERLGVSKDTIMRDLRHFEADQVSHLLSHYGLLESCDETRNET